MSGECLMPRELKLQQERLARRKEQQQRAEKDNEAFLAQIGTGR